MLGCSETPPPAGDADLTIAHCALFGASGEQVDCPLDLARPHAQATAATGMQFTLNFDATQLRFIGWTCQAEGEAIDPCAGSPKQNLAPALVSGHILSTTEKSPGVLQVVMFSPKGASLSEAYYNNQGHLIGSSALAGARFEVQPGADPAAQNHPVVLDNLTLSLGGQRAAFQITSDRIIVTEETP